MAYIVTSPAFVGAEVGAIVDDATLEGLNVRGLVKAGIVAEFVPAEPEPKPKPAGRKPAPSVDEVDTEGDDA